MYDVVTWNMMAGTMGRRRQARTEKSARHMIEHLQPPLCVSGSAVLGFVSVKGGLDDATPPVADGSRDRVLLATPGEASDGCQVSRARES